MTLRCTAKGCQSDQSIRTTNGFFFTHTDLNDRCRSDAEIVGLVSMVLQGSPGCATFQWTERGKRTVIHWIDLCRDVVDRFPKRQIMAVLSRLTNLFFAGNVITVNKGRLMRLQLH